MKIAIQGHPTRGKEVIQILKSLGGKNGYDQSGSNEKFVYFINNIGLIYSVTRPMFSSERRIYTLEEFEREFPFKVGDEVITSYGNIGIIRSLIPDNDEIPYCIETEKGYIYRHQSELKPCKEMKEERNITLTFDKAKEWYKKGGELKEIALQAFSERELNSLPRSWKDYCKNYPIKPEEIFIDGYSKFIVNNVGDRNPVHDKNICPSRKSAEAHLAMIQLEQLRDCYNNSCNDTNRIAIINNNGNIELYVNPPFNCFLTFKNHLLAREFFSNFKEIIEIAKELI